MVWSLELSRGLESDKVAAVAVPYLQGGRFLDVGVGRRKVWPSAIGVDNCKAFGEHTAAEFHTDARDLSLFADASVDAVFSSHLLEHFTREQVPEVLSEWSRVLKVGGHIVLYVPSANLYPKCGEHGANPDHKWDIYPGDIEAMFEDGSIPGQWTLLESEERSEFAEYSLFIVVRKDAATHTHGQRLVRNVWQRNPDGRKRALVIRYGAIGDILQTAGVFPLLKEQGYHVTLCCQPATQEVVLHNPYIDEWFIQEKDFVPNVALGPFWAEQARRYDLVVNHCESIEGTLLYNPERLNYFYSHEARHKFVGGVNYHERLFDIAGVPHDFRGCRFHATEQERWRARQFYKTLSGPVVVWAINGSSAHKVYPWTQIVSAWLVERTTATVVLVADGGIGKQLQDGIIDTMARSGVDVTRVIGKAGEWSIRDTLAFVQVCDCVVGPETGTTNSVAFMPVPKVVYLSHSSHENLTKHWINTHVLVPDTKRAPCYPCHRLHFNWEHCHQSEVTSAALCASAITPEQVFEAIMESLGHVKMRHVA